MKAAAPGDTSRISVHEAYPDRTDRAGSNVWFETTDTSEIRVFAACATPAGDFWQHETIGTYPASDWVHVEVDTVYPLTDPNDYTTWGTSTFKVNGVVVYTCTPWSAWWRFKTSHTNHYAVGAGLHFADRTPGAPPAHQGFYIDDVSVRIIETSTNATIASYNTSFEPNTNNPFPTASEYYPQATDFSIGAFATAPVTEMEVIFDEDMFTMGDPTHPDDVTNPNNWLLFETGSNMVFDTVECSTGVQPDDVQISIDSVSYLGGSPPFTATLSVNGGTPLGVGEYRLLACGTTTLVNTVGTPLNDGSDTPFTFLVGAGAGGPAGPAGGTAAGAAAAASALPATGFAPGLALDLPAQPAAKAYASTDLTLSIPRLGLTSQILGVPRVGGEWDVSWLGSSVGYLNGTTFPTLPGNTVLTAHVWGADNRPGPFHGLDGLSHGDQFSINAWGRTYTYEVR
ncbi:MAG: hypothetical protein KIS85_02555, partial [Anaerolineales bacterium]|nr:hypothetical protein [Anaerolineales bacterium]